MAPYVSSDHPSEVGARRQTRGAVLVLVASLLLGFLPEAAQEGIASGLRASVLRPFLAMQESVVRTRVRTARVEVLQDSVDRLVADLTSLTTLLEENQRLRDLLDLSDRLGPDWLAAAAVRPGTAGSESMFILDVGSREGVAPRSPVLTGEGLAGVVREVREGTAVGMDWTHPDFRASAMTRDGLTYGMMESRRGEFREADRLVLTGTPFSTTLEEGTVIVTSGLGAVFPRGIPVGRVRELAEAEGGWAKSYWVEPFVRPGAVGHVLVARAGALVPGRGSSGARPADRAGQAGDPLAPADTLPAVADVGAAFPDREIGTREERLARARARADSLERMTREVERLRARLDSLRSRPDSAGAAGVRP